MEKGHRRVMLEVRRLSLWLKADARPSSWGAMVMVCIAIESHSGNCTDTSGRLDMGRAVGSAASADCERAEEESAMMHKHDSMADGKW